MKRLKFLSACGMAAAALFSSSCGESDSSSSASEVPTKILLAASNSSLSDEQDMIAIVEARMKTEQDEKLRELLVLYLKALHDLKNGEKFDEQVAVFGSLLLGYKEQASVFLEKLEDRSKFLKMLLDFEERNIEKVGKENYRECINILLKKTGYVDEKGESYLFSCKNVVSLLCCLDAGADINSREIDGGKTLLMGKLVGKDIALAKCLLGRGANPNIQDKEGRTALWSALKNPEMFELLLEHGVDPDIRDEKGRSVRAYIEEELKKVGNRNRANAQNFRALQEILDKKRK